MFTSTHNKSNEEIAGGLKETGDPLDPYGISETEARKWDEPRDFWDVLKDPLWREWIKAIRKESHFLVIIDIKHLFL